jgi:hypothetical protein
MLDAKTIAMLQMDANRSAARRSGKSGTRLLDDAENNVGNATVLQPEILPPGQNFTVVKQSNPPRVLNLTAESKTGQSTTLVMTASRTQQAGVAGPVTGVIEFGNGTQSTRVEFDVPIGRYVGDFTSVSRGTQPEDSGAIIQVPTGVLRAYARYDNAFIQPTLIGLAFGGYPLPAIQLPPGAGPFAPNVSLCSVVIKAFANYYGRHFSKLYKTEYLYIGNPALPVTFVQTQGVYGIPAFAKNVMVVRQGLNESIPHMTLTLFDEMAIGSNSTPIPPIFQEIYDIPAGQYPIIPISGQNCLIQLQSASLADADKVTCVKLVYEIGF